MRNGATLASFRYNADGLRITTERLVGARTTRSHIVAEDFEWDETRGLARVHVMQGGAAIATVTSSWSGPAEAIVPPLAPRGIGWRIPDSMPAPGGAAALAALLLALAQLESLRRRGIPLARPALASLTLAAFVATTLVPAAAWSAPTDGDYNDDDRLDGRDVLHAMRIARGEIAASAADEDRLDVAPLGAAPQSPSTVDAGDVVLLLRGATGADVDGDGLGTDEELALGASPFKVDSDSDGLSDGFEVAAGTDPTDRDSNDNGLPDWLEDADGDDLINSNEEAAGTDPVFADTDGDGLTDSLDPDPRASVLYLFRDHQGSVVLVVREDGSVARRSLWSAFGKTDWYAASNPPPGNSPGYVGTFGYTGQRYEPAVDLYDYDARWYEPKLARFLQPDPVVPEPFRPQSLNRYSYVLNDPVNRIDPSGYTSTCSLESPGSCPGGTIGSGYDSGDYRGDDFDYGSADAGRGPGSLLRYYRRRNQGDASDGGRPQRPEHIWLTDFLGLPERLPARFFEPPSADLGPGQGLIPSAFNCGGTFCGQSPSSAPYVALPLLAPQAAARLAVAGGEVALTALGQSPRIKAALDSAGIFRPGFTSVGKLLPKSWQSGRFLPANAWASGYTAQFSAGFAAAQSDPGQAAWDTGTRSFRAGYVAGTIYSWWPQ